MKKELSTRTNDEQRTTADISTSSSVEANPMLSAAGKELMKPRFELIADYPGNSQPVGTVTVEISNASYFRKFPNNFRELQWWEHRKAEEMPKKVMSLADNKRDIFEIEEWDMEMLVGWIDKKERSCCSLLTFKPEYGYVPV